MRWFWSEGYEKVTKWGVIEGVEWVLFKQIARELGKGDGEKYRGNDI